MRLFLEQMASDESIIAALKQKNLGLTDDDNNTALHIACQDIYMQTPKIIDLLLQAKANPEACNTKGETPVQNLKDTFTWFQQNLTTSQDVILLFAVGKQIEDLIERMSPKDDKRPVSPEEEKLTGLLKALSALKLKSSLA